MQPFVNSISASVEVKLLSPGMQIATTQEQLSQITRKWAEENLPWAFVPTMGALHDGHLTLVRTAQKSYPKVAVSVFVNPTQFDRADDLERYPRQPEKDAALLADAGADLLFLPDVEVIYPSGTQLSRKAELFGLDQRFEGAARPGHFDGVVQVVRRLVQMVAPAAMFMGQKDAQQLAVLRRAAAQEFWPLDIVAVPTVREPSGLAMSSRNGLLSKEAFARAAVISQVLAKAAEKWHAGILPRKIEAEAETALLDAGLKSEYFSVVDAVTFTSLPDVPVAEQQGVEPLLLVVAWLEGVRLIDNWPLPLPAATP